MSFNGRGFDLPMILTRAMRYNVSFPSFYEVENKELGKGKWDGNYRDRYSGKFHFDLLDHVSEFGSVRGLKLDTLCASLNLPGKYDVHGDQVMELFFDGKIDKINEYCESDVLNTYWLFLKYELLRGNLTLDDYADDISVMSEWLAANCAQMGYTPVFCEAVERELVRLETQNYEDEPEFDEEGVKSQRKKYENFSNRNGGIYRISPGKRPSKKGRRGRRIRRDKRLLRRKFKARTPKHGRL